jgi:hypothetical protein
MKHLRLIAICFSLFLFTVAHAQRCYYESFAALDSNRSVEADFRLQRLSVKKLRKHLGPEYKLVASKKLKRRLERSALFLQVDSELFVNCNSLSSDGVSVGKGFAPCMRVGNDRVAFVSVRRDRGGLKSMPSVVEDVAFPGEDYDGGKIYTRYKTDGAYYERTLGDHDNLMNRMAYALDRRSSAKKRMAKIRSCYFLFKADPSDARIVDTRYMRYLLARYPNLQDEYMKLDPASREDPIIIWQYLRQIK